MLDLVRVSPTAMTRQTPVVETNKRCGSVCFCLFLFFSSPGTNVLGEVLSYPQRRRRRRRWRRQFQVKVFVY